MCICIIACPPKYEKNSFYFLLSFPRFEATKNNIDLKGFEKQSLVQGPAARSNSQRRSLNPKDTSVIDVVVVGDADCDDSDDDHTAEDTTDNEDEDPYSPEVLARVKQRRIKQAYVMHVCNTCFFYEISNNGKGCIIVSI